MYIYIYLVFRLHISISTYNDSNNRKRGGCFHYNPGPIDPLAFNIFLLLVLRNKKVVCFCERENRSRFYICLNVRGGTKMVENKSIATSCIYCFPSPSLLISAKY